VAARRLNVVFTSNGSVFIASLNLSVYNTEMYRLKIQCSDYINRPTFEKIECYEKSNRLNFEKFITAIKGIDQV
jgi:hypothetical protein